MEKNMRQEKIVLNKERNVTLTCYLQETGGEFRYVTRRPAVLILPGGGYQFCSDREAEPVAFSYLKSGYDAMILRYSVGEDSAWPGPLNDYEQAMHYIRSKAGDWNLYPDKIAVIGFSAGGHLAACAASMSENRPNAAILGYAVTAGSFIRECCPSAPDVISRVDEKTCPCFLFATRNDSVVPIQNTIQMMDALDKAGVSFESHIYAYGPHGFSTADSSVQSPDSVICSRAGNWVGDSIAWLKDIFGDFSSDGMTQPRCEAHVNADGEAFLSVSCTIGHLAGNPEARKILTPLFVQMKSAQGGAVSGPDAADLNHSPAGRMKLRDALAYVHAAPEVIESIDGRLKKIPNV